MSNLTGMMEQVIKNHMANIEKMEKKIDEWEKESISEKEDVVQNLKSELLEVKEKFCPVLITLTTSRRVDFRLNDKG